MDDRLMEILMNKPEMVNRLPSWMLSGQMMEQMKHEHSLAIIEIAGRDSIAAALEEARKENFSAFLPTIVYTGTLYGNWESPFQALQRLKEHKEILGNLRIYPAVVLGSPKFWWQLCGRYNYELLEKFGFYSPCTACHLYFHTVRIPLALELGCRTIIAGERERHDKRIKLSQVRISLEVCEEFFQELGVDLLLPLRNISKGSDISAIVGNEWEEGKDQLECVLARNYQRKDGEVRYSEKSISSFFHNFALPLARSWVQEHSGKHMVKI